MTGKMTCYTEKNDLARHNLTLEDAIELALNKPLWRLLAASGATHSWCMPNNDDDNTERRVELHGYAGKGTNFIYAVITIWYSNNTSVTTNFYYQIVDKNREMKSATTSTLQFVSCH